MATMLSKVSRICLRNRIKPFNKQSVLFSLGFSRSFQTNMLCMQCEQTSHGSGCTSQGICGKFPETANMQDLLLYVNNGLSQCVHNIEEKNIDPPLREKVRAHVMESTFSTLTNVNFSEDRMIEYINTTIELREQLRPKLRELFPQQQEFERSENSPSNYFIQDSEELNEDAQRLSSLHATKQYIGDDNCFGLRECAVYGLKGTMAYFHHAESLNLSTSNGTYSEQERDEIYRICFGTMNDLCADSDDLNYWLGLNMKIGETNVKVMELLDRSHNALYGTPEPTNVSSVPVEGKCILLSGHDILNVKQVLDLIEKKGLDINVYTHGELLPAHSYPELKKHERLAGHFGGAWQNQYKEFKQFPGPILMTSNCLMPPRTRYKDRLYTTGCMGYDEVKHIDTQNEQNLEELLMRALECEGFDGKSIEAWSETKPHLCGFGHAAILSHAETVINAIKSGDLQHIFVIGGCDGTEKARSYFTDLGGITPDNSIILTLGCGKFRLRGLELGDIGGIPRILDMGQCNDAYGAVVVAMKLAEALGTDVHSLPLHFAVSWFEQKAVAVFLSLLHLGIKNIRLGPELPAFLTEDVRSYLFDNLGVQKVNLNDANSDLKQMLAETPQ